jgi:trans-2,3-dihydro-3-hydroxyanthranilate isomerase
MSYRYVTTDVFTGRRFGGNPLAVILDATALTTPQMQSIAREFNYAETTFVLPPRDVAHTAHVRIFTPTTEVPFAGHPTVGTAVMLARELESGPGPARDSLILEMAAGHVPVRLLRDGGQVVGAEFRAPRALCVGGSLAIADAAACLSLDPADLCATAGPPHVLSVGLPFLVVELASRDALRRAQPVHERHARLLPPLGTDAIYAWVRGETPGLLYARMFSPLDGCVEDAATGSATAATLASLMQSEPGLNPEAHWRVEQGIEMGRPSLLLGRTVREGDGVIATYIAGHAVPVMRGVIALD